MKEGMKEGKDSLRTRSLIPVRVLRGDGSFTPVLKSPARGVISNQIWSLWVNSSA